MTGDNLYQRRGRRVARARMPGFSPVNLRRLRLARDLSAQDLADLVGTSANSVHKWEAATATPDPRHAKRIADALSVAVRDLTSLADANIGLSELRALRGMTASDLAERIGIDRTTVARIEVGHRRPTGDQARQFAEALDLTVDALFDLWDRVRANRLDTLRARGHRP